MSLQSEDGSGVVKVERAACSYKNLSQKFKFDKKRDFKAQYSHIYFTRLQKMRKSLHDSANRKWGGVSIVSISGLKDLSDKEKCCIVGTLFKDMELKPSILKEISQQHHLVPPPPKKKYIYKTDSLVLEDQGQRICLTGDILVDELVTGVTIALLGYINDNGKFHVEEYCFAGECPTVGVAVSNGMEEVSNEDDRYIAIVSGLNVGSAHCDWLSLQLFIDYITGTVGGAADRCSNIVRLIIAGNSVSDNPVKSSITANDSKTKYQTKNYEAQSIEAVQELDSVLTQLGSCLPVDVMPGSHDPTNHMLPQRPLHRCMFPQASRYSMLQCVTNPYQARVGGVLLLGTSGQNIDDVMRFSSYNDPMTILEHTLSWKHMAPTTPDTLSCFPYTENDPFILDDSPQIYFAGNQPSLQHKIIEDTASGIRGVLVTVPDFDQTHSCVLVNLKTLKCSEVQFHTSLLSSSPQHPVDTGDTPMTTEPLEEDINYMELYQDDGDDDMD